MGHSESETVDDGTPATPFSCLLRIFIGAMGPPGAGRSAPWGPEKLRMNCWTLGAVIDVSQAIHDGSLPAALQPGLCWELRRSDGLRII